MPSSRVRRVAADASCHAFRFYLCSLAFSRWRQHCCSTYTGCRRILEEGWRHHLPTTGALPFTASTSYRARRAVPTTAALTYIFICNMAILLAEAPPLGTRSMAGLPAPIAEEQHWGCRTDKGAGFLQCVPQPHFLRRAPLRTARCLRSWNLAREHWTRAYH